jgi:heme oxygenase
MPWAGHTLASVENHGGLRARLRARLAPLHARLDRGIEASCLGEPLDLRRLLAIHHAALGAIVPALESAEAARLFPGWDGRSRLAALEADMAALRADAPHCLSTSVFFPTEQAVWGALYAVEGSRLGNQVLLRRLAKRGNNLGQHATRFLAHCPEEAVTWPHVVKQLEALDYCGDDFTAAVRGAEKVFIVYLIATEQCLRRDSTRTPDNGR